MPPKPHPVNRAVYLFQQNAFGHFVVVCQTAVSDPPDLFISCDPFTPAAKTRKVGGGVVPHGNRASYGKAPHQYPTTTSDGITHTWDIAPPCQPGETCEWFVAALGAKPDIDWSTLIHQCRGGPGPGDGYWLDTVDMTPLSPTRQWGLSAPGIAGIAILGNGGVRTGSAPAGVSVAFDVWSYDPTDGSFQIQLTPNAQASGAISVSKNWTPGPAGGTWHAGLFNGMGFIAVTNL